MVLLSYYIFKWVKTQRQRKKSRFCHYTPKIFKKINWRHIAHSILKYNCFLLREMVVLLMLSFERDGGAINVLLKRTSCNQWYFYPHLSVFSASFIYFSLPATYIDSNIFDIWLPSCCHVIQNTEEWNLLIQSKALW